MREALGEAEKALERGEVPVGAVIVREGEIIGRAHNEVEIRSLAAAHAEMLALERASRTVGDWRLEGCTIYVTVEPCHMCLGALYLSRVQRLVYGARQPRSGACGSIGDLHRSGLYGHEMEVTGGVLEERSTGLLKEFFAGVREEEKKRRDARAG
ncbi:MAG: nucleoside deaminase [Candidatus Krumholzibacteriota bacterium]|nr:nucleoside deaminase [Candidatus Krumholzibacteriota bacterium]